MIQVSSFDENDHEGRDRQKKKEIRAKEINIKRS